MFHVPITKTDDAASKIEFCHIVNPSAYSGTWEKGKFISLDNVKINIFVGGEFSLVSESTSFSPANGDFCVFPPHGLHYGSISRPTHLDYYQLDIGLSAFDGVPEGSELIADICRLSRECGALVRSGGSELIRICEDIERAISEGDLSLAFALTVLILGKMKRCYLSSSCKSVDFLSPGIRKVIEYIGENFSSDIKVEELARQLGISPSYLSRRFKREVGTSLHSYVVNRRITESIKLLEKGNVADAAYATGFCDSSHYIASFKRIVGCTPAEYAKNHFKREF